MQIDLLAGIDFRLIEAEHLGKESAARGEWVSANPHRPRCSAIWHAWDKGWQKEYCKPQQIPTNEVNFESFEKSSSDKMDFLLTFL